MPRLNPVLQHLHAFCIWVDTNLPTMKFLIPLVLLIVLSCASEEAPYEISDDYLTLLAGESSKSWKHAQRFNNGTRMNMEGCFLSHEQTFGRGGSVSDNLSQHTDCGESLVGEWKVVKDQKGHFYIRISSKQIPKLMNIEADFKLFKILQLCRDQLTLEYTHRQFSDKLTTFTDVMVPVGTPVEGRDFHW